MMQDEIMATLTVTLNLNSNGFMQSITQFPLAQDDRSANLHCTSLQSVQRDNQFQFHVQLSDFDFKTLEVKIQGVNFLRDICEINESKV